MPLFLRDGFFMTFGLAKRGRFVLFLLNSFLYRHQFWQIHPNPTCVLSKLYTICFRGLGKSNENEDIDFLISLGILDD